MNRDMLSRRLQRKGHEVLMAADGMQAILMAESETPDLILLDMSLPVIDGWEAARRLKASPTTAAVPIVALTAHAMAGDREKALAAGCDDYDTKPVDFPQLARQDRRAARAPGLSGRPGATAGGRSRGRGGARRSAPRARTSPSGRCGGPARRAAARSSAVSSLAVTTTTGMRRPASVFRSSATNSKPSISGIMRSSRMRSGTPGRGLEARRGRSRPRTRSSRRARARGGPPRASPGRPRRPAPAAASEPRRKRRRAATSFSRSIGLVR